MYGCVIAFIHARFICVTNKNENTSNNCSSQAPARNLPLPLLSPQVFEDSYREMDYPREKGTLFLASVGMPARVLTSTEHRAIEKEPAVEAAVASAQEQNHQQQGVKGRFGTEISKKASSIAADPGVAYLSAEPQAEFDTMSTGAAMAWNRG